MVELRATRQVVVLAMVMSYATTRKLPKATYGHPGPNIPHHTYPHGDCTHDASDHSISPSITHVTAAVVSVCDELWIMCTIARPVVNHHILQCVQGGCDSRSIAITNISQPKYRATGSADMTDIVGAQEVFVATLSAAEECICNMCLKDQETNNTCEKRKRGLIKTRASAHRPMSMNGSPRQPGPC